MKNRTAVNQELVEEIPVDLISPSPWQKRRSFDPQSLQELADSIRERGLLQPVLLRRPNGDESAYELVAGERRLRAHKLIGKETIRSIVQNMSSEEAREAVLIENIQRENLLPMEEAENLADLVETKNGDRQAVADKIKKSLTYVADRLLLVSLPIQVKSMIDEGKINIAQAKVISELPDDKAKVDAANSAAKLNLTASELKGRFQRMLNPKKKIPSAGENNVKYQQVSTAVVHLYDLLEKFNFDMLGDQKKKESLLKQITILEKSLTQVKEHLV